MFVNYKLKKCKDQIGPRPHNAEEIWKRHFFTLKTHQIFPVHTTPRKLEDATITGHFGFEFELPTFSGDLQVVFFCLAFIKVMQETMDRPIEKRFS